jgi:hypothetical protein
VNSHPKPAVVVSLVAAGLALPACGGDDDDETPQPAQQTPATTTTAEKPATVNGARVERELKRNFRDISVTCPDDVPARKGGKFKCDVDPEQGSATIRLTQLDSAGTKLRFTATFKSKSGGVARTTRLHGEIDAAR